MKLKPGRIILFVALAILAKALDTVYFFDKVKTLRFYIELAQNIFVITVCWYIIKFISSFLNNKILWEKYPVKRLLTQLILSTLLTLIGVYILFIPLSIYVIKESVFEIIKPVHILFAIVLVVFFNMYQSWKYLTVKFKNEAAKEDIPDFILVNKGNINIPIRYENIIDICIKDKTVFLRDSTNNMYVLSNSIEYYCKILPYNLFYRINRQVIVNKLCIKLFENVENRKVKVIYGGEMGNNEAVISQKKVTAFKKWYTGKNN